MCMWDVTIGGTLNAAEEGGWALMAWDRSGSSVNDVGNGG
jgi:hypothetical protein